MLLPAGEGGTGELSPVDTGERPDLVLPDLAGRDFDLAMLRGRVVVVNFWASWCTPCIAEMPSIQRLADALAGSRVSVIGVNVGEGELRAKAVSERLGIRFPVLIDTDSAAFGRWGAKVLPATYVLDEEGVVRYLGLGPLEWDSAEVLERLSRLGIGELRPNAD